MYQKTMVVLNKFRLLIRAIDKIDLWHFLITNFIIGVILYCVPMLYGQSIPLNMVLKVIPYIVVLELINYCLKKLREPIMKPVELRGRLIDKEEKEAFYAELEKHF